MAHQHDFGRVAEDLAARYLADRGYSILDRNYRAGHKEIDLVAGRKGLVAFVEVKARASSEHGHPLEAITFSKRREIEYAARVWITQNGRPGLDYRFDAISVLTQNNQIILEHIQSAWLASR